MKKFEVFEEEQELDRLGVQNQLLRKYEMPLYQEVLSVYKQIKILDIGCNDGAKTHDRFSEFYIGKVIGIECSEKLAEKAQDKFGGARFAFYCCNVEDDCFISKMTAIMKENQIEKFDVINISFVLMHLDNPEKLLKTVRSLLSPNGKLVIVEADDSASTVLPDTEDLLSGFTNILNQDPMAGNRDYSKKLADNLMKIGYSSVKTIPSPIIATGTQSELKKKIFDVFFSYAPEDYAILRRQCPDNTEYKSADNWLLHNYEKLRSLVMTDGVGVSMGIVIFTCSVSAEAKQSLLLLNDGELNFELMSEDTMQAAIDLCDFCVGKNMYTREYMESVLHNPNHRFYLLKNKNDEIVAYTYFYLTDLDDMAEFTKTSKEQLSAMSRKEQPVIGNIRSIGIAEKYRHHHLGVDLMSFSIEEMKRMNADVVFGAFWKINGTFPMAASLKKFDFKHLIDAHNIWYNNEKLYCPVCKGRCKCDAALYYIDLGEINQ